MALKENLTKNLTTLKNKLAPYGVDTSRAIIKLPAKLFENATTNSKFGRLFLFQNFGQSNNVSLQLNSQITTHYTEENYAINDHWALEPITYTLTGLIGEVIYRPSTNWSNKIISKVKDYVAPLSVISPTFDSYTQSAINLTNQVEEVYKRYERTAKEALRNAGISEGVATTNQQYIIQQLTLMREGRQLIPEIYTPYGTLTNMAIVSINMGQKGSSYSSELEIQLREWRDTESQSREATEAEKSELAKIQSYTGSQGGMAGTKRVELSENSTLKTLKDTLVRN